MFLAVIRINFKMKYKKCSTSAKAKIEKKKKKIQISQTFFVWRWFLEPYGRRWEVAVMVER